MAVASRDFKLGKAAGGSQTIVAPVVLLTDVHSMGLELAQSLSFITGFYLGQGRRIPCLVEALLRTKARDTDDVAGRGLLRGSALLEKCRCRQDDVRI